jgi:hypothetical protein
MVRCLLGPETTGPQQDTWGVPRGQARHGGSTEVASADVAGCLYRPQPPGSEQGFRGTFPNWGLPGWAATSATAQIAYVLHFTTLA